MAEKYAKRFEEIVDPLVAMGMYESKEEVLHEVLSDIAKKKISMYRSIIQRFKSKYNMSFEKFTGKLKEKATPKLEDDWIEWESARDFLKAWKRASKEIGIRSS
jgi:hypothetical protein